ncbi:DUF262 domain-containing protein [Candidatus Palauibacter sp.]|uniref:DUF262 domain-containing protein n=1 Tax=Candidatus Palauibacter sp. TaxID=3101350 RepID=UPI003B013469
MAFQTPIAIKEAINNIQNSRYLLPAIQREFVWRPYQIERLFDSLMRGYPIGSFLFWRVEPETAKNYNFYQFITNYDQRKPHNPVFGAPGAVPALKAVLDGQQRLTALNVGLYGSGRWKLPRLWWNNPRAFPERRLFLDLLAPRLEDEDELSYKFRLLPIDKTGRPERPGEEAHWYRVGDILDVEDSSDLIDVVFALELTDTSEPLKMLTRLHRVVHGDGVISAYEETNQDPERVLNIFVRANKGGTALSYSDMLLSMAVAQWDKVDARKEIHALVDEIRDIGGGFSFNHDFVLKACLMLGDSDSIRFKVENFKKPEIGTLQDEWDRIRKTIVEAVEVVSSFGYSRQSLTSANALLPIAYYLHHRQARLGDTDRNAMRYWLIRSLLKRGTWSSGVDNLLVAIRQAIKEDPLHDGFPIRAIEGAMASRGKKLTFDEEELQDLADAWYDGRACSLLFLLYDFVDVATNRFHVDHVFPRALMTPARLRKAGVAEGQVPEYEDRVNRLANLQLLEVSKHMPKGVKLPGDWLCTHYSEEERRNHCHLHDLGDLPAEITGFIDFYEARRNRMLEKLRGLLVHR